MSPHDLPDNVAAVIDAFPAESRAMAYALHAQIMQIADDLPAVGPVAASLKWGQPSFVAKGGTPLRIGVPKGGGCAIFVHCQSGVIARYAEAFPGLDEIVGNRAVIFRRARDIDAGRLALLIRHALTYHRGK